MMMSVQQRKRIDLVRQWIHYKHMSYRLNKLMVGR